MRANVLTTTLSLVAIAYAGVSATACKRSDRAATPAPQVQTQTPVRDINQPMTVTGCLRAGEASDTFVLTSSEQKDGMTPSTYLLISNNDANNNASFRDNVGKRVEISGTLSTEQQTSALTPAEPARNSARNKPTGTSGTPTVESQTQVDMRQFQVSSLRSLGERCDKK